MTNLILTPEDEEFSKWLVIPPPGWKEAGTLNFAITPDSSVLTPVPQSKLDELIIDAGLYREEEEEEQYQEESILVYPDYVSKSVDLEF